MDQTANRNSGYWKKSLTLIAKHPFIFLPFIFLASLEMIWLGISFYTPRPPISLILAPPVRVFMGEQFLHYPLNFLILPRLVFIGRIFIYITFGLLSLVMTMAIIIQIEEEKEEIRFLGNFNRAVRRYPSLFVLGLAYCFGAFIIYKAPRLLLSRITLTGPGHGISSVIVLIFSFLGMVLLEGMLIYTVLFVFIKRENLITGIKKGFKFFGKFFINTFWFVFIFRGLNLLTILAKNKSPLIVEKFFPLFPEAFLLILAFEIVLLLFSNFFITILASEFFLTKREDI